MATAGGYDNRYAALFAITSVNGTPFMYYRNNVIPQNIATAACALVSANPVWTPLVDSTGGCGTAAQTADGTGNGGGVAIKAGAGGASGAFGAATTRVGGTGGLSALGGAGGAGDGVTNGTPNAACVAGSQPGGGGGGGAANATVRSAGCAGGAGQVVVWW